MRESLWVLILFVLWEVQSQHVPEDIEPEPITIIPLHYTLRVRPVLDDGHTNLLLNTVSADIRVRVKALQEDNRIRLYQRGLLSNPEDITVTNPETGKSIAIQNFTGHDSRKRSHEDFLSSLSNGVEIQLEENFKPGDHLEIFIPYRIPLPQVSQDQGTYAFRSPFSVADYTDPVNNETKRFAVTRLTKDDSRKLLPLIVNNNDDTERRVVFEVVVGRVENKYTSVSNMKLEHTEVDSENPGWVWDYYNVTPPIAPHQLFIMVSDFSKVSGHTSGDNPGIIETWTPGFKMDENVTSIMTETSKKLAEFYHDTFKLDLPSQKLDIVRLPKYYGEGNYLGVAVVESELHEDNEVIKVLANEIARQWFGVLINSNPPAPHEDTQLNPGMVTYLRYQGIKQLFADYPLEELSKIPESRLPEEYLGTLMILLDDMLENKIMDSAIQLFINTWSQNPEVVPTEEQLFDAVQTSIEMRNASHLLPSNVTVKEIMADWTRFARREYPIVKIEVVDENTIDFSQEIFDSFKDNPLVPPEFKSPTNSTWYIPVKLLTEEGHIHTFWLPKNKTSNCKYSGNGDLLLDTSKSILANPTGVAAYRTVYDSKLSHLLAEKLDKNHNAFSRTARFQLIDDQVFAVKNNDNSIEAVLELTKYLDKENSKEVWSVIAKHLIGELLEPLMEDKEAYENLQNYFSPKMEAFVKRIRPSQMENVDGLQKVCLYLRVPACVSLADQYVNRWKQNPEIGLTEVFPVTEDLSPSDWLCTVISEDKYGTQHWNFVLDKFLKNVEGNAEETGTEENLNIQHELLRGLSCSTNSALLSQLNQSLQKSNETRQQILNVISGNSELGNLNRMYDSVKKDVVSGKVSLDEFFAAISQLLMSKWNSQDNIEDLRKFIDEQRVILEPVLSHLNKSLEDSSVCKMCEWWSQIGNKAKEWLSKQM